jgi:hypothetical protein
MRNTNEIKEPANDTTKTNYLDATCPDTDYEDFDDAGRGLSVGLALGILLWLLIGLLLLSVM